MGNPAMIISENKFLVYSLLMGICMTFFYDIFRILRRVWRHNGLMISVEDGLFWVVTAVSVFYLMHTQSNGTLRWFAVCGAVCGMGIYKKTLSRPFVKWISFLLRKIADTIWKLLEIAGKPFRFCIKKGRKRLTIGVKTLKIKLCKQKQE